MVFHVVNLIVMVLMPMVVIHVKDSGFSLCKSHFTYRFTREFRARIHTILLTCRHGGMARGIDRGNVRMYVSNVLELPRLSRARLEQYHARPPPHPPLSARRGKCEFMQSLTAIRSRLGIRQAPLIVRIHSFAWHIINF